MKTAVVIQARLGSTRFPGKVLADLGGKTVLEHVLERSKEIGFPVILATRDVELAKFLPTSSIIRPKGDVLSRYMDAAEVFELDRIIRITADCPMLRPELCRLLIEKHGHLPYAAIGHPQGGFPKGYGCEVFSRLALEMANAFAKHDYDREHVTPWMERNLRMAYLQNHKDESHLNYCVDTPEDLERLRKLN